MQDELTLERCRSAFALVNGRDPTEAEVDLLRDFATDVNLKLFDTCDHCVRSCEMMVFALNYEILGLRIHPNGDMETVAVADVLGDDVTGPVIKYEWMQDFSELPPHRVWFKVRAEDHQRHLITWFVRASVGPDPSPSGLEIAPRVYEFEVDHRVTDLDGNLLADEKVFSYRHSDTLVDKLPETLLVKFLKPFVARPRRYK